MARIETDPNYTSPTFSRATAPTDPFKKEDVQALAAAMSTHDHSTGKGLSVAAALADGSISNAKLASDTARANVLVNGSFEVWQRGNGPFVNAPVAADRWGMGILSGDSLSVSRDAVNIDASGSQYCAACTYTRSTGGSLLSQGLGADRFYVLGRTLSLSVRVKTTTANAVRLTINNGSVWTPGPYHSGGGAYETLTLSVAIPAAAGATVAAAVEFDQSCTAYIDNAMMVVGSVPADYAPLHPADDLARCLRYYEKIGPTPNMPEVSLYQAAGSSFGQTLTWAAKKAVTPTVTINGTFAYINASTAALSAPSVDGVFFGAQATALGATIVYSNNSGYITSEANP